MVAFLISKETEVSKLERIRCEDSPESLIEELESMCVPLWEHEATIYEPVSYTHLDVYKRQTVFAERAFYY